MKNIVALTLCGVFAAAAAFHARASWEYVQLDDTTVSITQAHGEVDSNGTLTIPAEVDGFKVVAVDSAFGEYTLYSKVAIPASVKRIEDFAFAWQSNLREVVFNGKESDIAMNKALAFAGSPYGLALLEAKPFQLITKEETFWRETGNGEEQEVVGKRVLGFYGKCPETLEIPEGVTGVYLDADMCPSVTNLVKIVLPSTFKHAEEGDFYGCSNLAEVEGLPADAEVDVRAFVGTKYEKLRPFEWVIEEGWNEVTKYDPDLGEWVGTGVSNHYYEVEGFHGSCPEKLVIPEGVTRIDEDFLSYNPEYAEDGDYDEHLGDRASVANVKSIVFPKKLEGIDGFSFEGFTSLEEVSGIPETAGVDTFAFVGTPYEALRPFELVLDGGRIRGFHGACPETLVIPEGVERIDGGAFAYYGADADVVCGEERDEYYPLGDRGSVTNVSNVVFPSTLENIGHGAFWGCSSLAGFSGIPEEADVSEGAFAGTLYEARRPFELVVEDGVLSGFHGECPEELVIPEGVVTIDGGAFSLAFSLYSEALEDHARSYINWRSLMNLRSVRFPASLKRIYDDAFSRLPNLAKVTFAGNPADIAIDEYSNAFSLTPAFVPRVVDRTLVGCYGSGFTEAVVPEGVTNIAKYAIQATSLKKVTLPKSLKSIEERGFYDCFNLEEVVYLGDESSVERDDAMFVGSPYAKTLPFRLLVHGGYELYGYLGELPSNLTVPEGVTQIYGIMDDYGRYNALAGSETLVSLVLPASLDYISGAAFSDCPNLKSVTFAGNAENVSVSSSCFRNTPYAASQPFGLCTEETSWTDSKGVEHEGLAVYGFYGECPSVLKIPEGVVSIGFNAFQGAGAIQTLHLPSSLREIEYEFDEIEGTLGAFAGCTNLSKVVWGDKSLLSDKEMLTFAFAGTPWLKTAVKFQLNTWLKQHVSYGEGFHLVEDEYGTHEVQNKVTNHVHIVGGYYGACPEVVTIPAMIGGKRVSRIDNGAFFNVPGLKKVVIEGAPEIEYGAFYACPDLEEVVFRTAVGYVESGAFEGCRDVTFVMPESVTDCYYEDKDSDFYADYTEMEYPEMFSGIEGGVTVFAPRGSGNIFYPTVAEGSYYCPSVPVDVKYYTPLTLDAGEGKLDGQAEVLYVDDAETPLPVPVRDGWTFDGWFVDGAKLDPQSLVMGMSPVAVAGWTENRYSISFDANGGTGSETYSLLRGEEIVRPEAAKDGYVFAGWEPVPPATAPASNATYVAQWVAAAANNVVTRSAPGGVAIKSCSFPYGKIEIPATVNGQKVVAIMDYAFFGQKGITEVVIPDSVTIVGVKAFKGCANLAKVTMPARLATLGQAAFQDCVSLTEVDVPALGDNYLWSSTFEGCTSLRRVSLPEGITAIGTSSFANCKALVEVNIPKSVRNIKSFAFFSCEKLSDVELPSKLAKIEQKAFKNCVSMTAIEIPSGVTSLGKAVFFNSGLVEATVPGGIAKVDDYCFQKCAALKKMTLSEGVKETGASVWANDDALEEVVFPKSLEKLGGYAFFRCPSLATLWNFSSLSNLSTIGEKAFKHCTSLKTLTMPSQVTALPKEMCNYCSSLEGVYGTERVTSIGQSAFSNCPSLKSVAGLDAAALALVKRGREYSK